MLRIQSKARPAGAGVVLGVTGHGGPRLEPRVWPPLLGAALIIRDEAARLAACLESLRGVVDEVFVHDTGSTDASPDIALAFGARVEVHPWTDDFSFHRNASLAGLTAPWALVIDGDEVLREGQALRALVERAHADPRPDAPEGIAVRVDGIVHPPRAAGAATFGAAAFGAATEGTPPDHVAERALQVRAFRRDLGSYRYPVHNQLTGVHRVAVSTAVIEASYRGTLQAKVERSRALLERMLASDPRSSHASFFLTKAHFAAGDLVACLRQGEHTLRLLDERAAEGQATPPDAAQVSDPGRTQDADQSQNPGQNPGNAVLWVWLFYAALAAEGLDAAERRLHDGLARHPDFADLRHCALVAASLRWMDAAQRGRAYDFVSQSSLAHLGGLEPAAALLGLPLQFERRPVGAP